jgi:hypothetical protein
MQKNIIYTPEVKFCVRYLLGHGVDAFNFGAVQLSLDESDAQYTLVKVKKDSFFDELASKLRDLWPPGGRMIGGKEYPWRDSVENISKRLMAMWAERFPKSDKQFTIEDCLSAARAYLAQYENDTKYMLSVNKFIWKQRNLVMSNGLIKHVMESRLADMLEGKIEYQKIDDEWNDILNSATEDDGEII